MTRDNPDLVDELQTEAHDLAAEMTAAPSTEQAVEISLTEGIVGAMAMAELDAGPVVARFATAALPEIRGLGCPECGAVDTYRWRWPGDYARYCSEIECTQCGRTGVFMDLVVLRREI